jgi:adenosylcobinamide-GDP ribazoletransferase
MSGWLADLRTAITFLTVIPAPGRAVEGRKPGPAFAWFPLVGLLIGALLALVAALAPSLPFSPGVTALLVLLMWAVITGGLHLDGFGDSCDGLLAHVDAERRLAIMRDPRAGSWAVVGLVLLLLGKYVLLAEIIAAGRAPWLILPPVVGRWALGLAAYHYPYARADGLGGLFREGLAARHVILGGALTVAIAVIVAVAGADFAPVALLPPLIAWGVVLIVGRWAAARLGGGLTGDVYGALCELTEWAVLLTLAMGLSA